MNHFAGKAQWQTDLQGPLLHRGRNQDRTELPLHGQAPGRSAVNCDQRGEEEPNAGKPRPSLPDDEKRLQEERLLQGAGSLQERMSDLLRTMQAGPLQQALPRFRRSHVSEAREAPFRLQRMSWTVRERMRVRIPLLRREDGR